MTLLETLFHKGITPSDKFPFWFLGIKFTTEHAFIPKNFEGNTQQAIYDLYNVVMITLEPPIDFEKQDYSLIEEPKFRWDSSLTTVYLDKRDFEYSIDYFPRPMDCIYGIYLPEEPLPLVLKLEFEVDYGEDVQPEPFYWSIAPRISG